MATRMGHPQSMSAVPESQPKGLRALRVSVVKSRYPTLWYYLSTPASTLRGLTVLCDNILRFRLS